MRVATGRMKACDLVVNSEGRFGQATNFKHSALEQSGKAPVPLLFSNDQIQVARERAEANREDLLPFEPESARIAKAVEAALIAERERVASQAKYAAAHQRFALGAMALVSLALGAGIGALL